MGFRAGLKNAGKWQRVNDTIRDKPDFKDAINSNPGVRAALTELQTVVHNEAVAAGVADQFDDSLVENGFPIPLRVWQGRLVYSHREPKQKGMTANQKAFRLAAKHLRDHVDTMFRSYAMLDDVYDRPPSDGPNAGGEVGNGGGGGGAPAPAPGA